MPKKPRCSSCSTGWCKNHVFHSLLQEKLQNSSLSTPKQVNLTLSHRQNNLFQKIIPLLNPDKKFYTPSFYLEEEKKYYTDNDQRVLRNHKLKVDEDMNSNQTIWMPRHARKRNYCFVCKQDYDDYLDHLNGQSHKKCLRNNAFTGLILQLQDKFAHQNQLSKQNEKQILVKRQLPTDDSSSLSIQEHSAKNYQFIRKLIKTDQEPQSQELHLKMEQN